MWRVGEIEVPNNLEEATFLGKIPTYALMNKYKKLNSKDRLGNMSELKRIWHYLLCFAHPLKKHTLVNDEYILDTVCKHTDEKDEIKLLS